MQKKFFLTAREAALAEKSSCLGWLQRVSVARGVVFVAAVLALAGGYDGSAGLGALGAALLFVFARLVVCHRRAARRLVLLTARLSVLDGMLTRFDGRWRDLAEDGAAYLAAARPQLTDLHVFGPSSLYQYLCQARTRAGRERLAAALRTEAPQGAALALVRARHGAIRELAAHPQTALTLASYGALLPDGQDVAPLLAALAEAPRRPSGLRRAACVLLPAANVAACALALLGAVPLLLPGGLIAGSFLLTWLAARRSEAVLAPLMPLAQALGAYRRIFLTLERAPFASPHLAALQRVLREGAAAAGPCEDAAARGCGTTTQGQDAGHGAAVREAEADAPAGTAAPGRAADAPRGAAAPGYVADAPAGAAAPGRSASAGLRLLARLAAAVSWRRNFFFYFLANGLFVFDFAAGLLFERWCRREGARLAPALAVWHECEVLLSLSTLAVTQARTVFPVFLEGEAPRLTATALRNPLLPEESAVANDAALTAGTTIITGSNMSGKTTWLRTLGMNAVLAWAGAPVCAAAFSLSPLALYTSIRVDDSLAEGMSTFYAELLRIKEMVAAERTGRPLLLLIDEIFKGTNSADRITGARAALAHLTNAHSITLVSTHDFELCDLEVPGGRVRNAHFEEQYQDGKIAFDYRLRAGRCQTTNAVYLLRLVGILDEER
ncbi:MutS family DNA mismatch repair protein [Selenomonas bovis]|uniref:MutS family DNA mismatch repair protein n=1 Tax=Selenomonas bovis TaxID=416586 RepID=UPI0004E159CA|nr:MutS family DNA mismatch repair protein [Selenomonas bovis]